MDKEDVVISRVCNMKFKVILLLSLTKAQTVCDQANSIRNSEENPNITVSTRLGEVYLSNVYTAIEIQTLNEFDQFFIVFEGFEEIESDQNNLALSTCRQNNSKIQAVLSGSIPENSTVDGVDIELKFYVNEISQDVLLYGYFYRLSDNSTQRFGNVIFKDIFYKYWEPDGAVVIFEDQPSKIFMESQIYQLSENITIANYEYDPGDRDSHATIEISEIVIFQNGSISLESENVTTGNDLVPNFSSEEYFSFFSIQDQRFESPIDIEGIGSVKYAFSVTWLNLNLTSGIFDYFQTMLITRVDNTTAEVTNFQSLDSKRSQLDSTTEELAFMTFRAGSSNVGITGRWVTEYSGVPEKQEFFFPERETDKVAVSYFLSQVPDLVNPNNDTLNGVARVFDNQLRSNSNFSAPIAELVEIYLVKLPSELKQPVKSDLVFIDFNNQTFNDNQGNSILLQQRISNRR